MRFLISEHKALVKLIEAADRKPEEFSFRKKGGVLFVDHPDMAKSFSFHRHKETVLDNSGNWTKHVSYMFDKPSKSDFSTDWDGILFAFEIWLETLKK